jgi:hypothetical protein
MTAAGTHRLRGKRHQYVGQALVPDLDSVGAHRQKHAMLLSNTLKRQQTEFSGQRRTL